MTRYKNARYKNPGKVRAFFQGKGGKFKICIARNWYYAGFISTEKIAFFNSQQCMIAMKGKITAPNAIIKEIYIKNANFFLSVANCKSSIFPQS